jgi:hypothetical protein
LIRARNPPLPVEIHTFVSSRTFGTSIGAAKVTR